MFIPTTAPYPDGFRERKALIHLLQGDKTKARAEFEKGREISEKCSAKAPGDAARHERTAGSLAALGQSRKRSPKATRSELLPNLKDAFDGRKLHLRARPRLWLHGESDEAFRLFACSSLFANPLHISTVPDVQARSSWGSPPLKIRA